MMRYHRRIDRLDRLIAAREAIPQLPPKPAFDWEAFDRLYAEQVADWTPAEHEGAEQWYMGELGDKASPPLHEVIATEQAYIGVLREHDRSRPDGAGGSAE